MAREPLAARYDKARIEEAEERRTKLAYTRLHVGGNPTPRIDRILGLLFQAHQNYYLGLFDATSVLCGVLVEQAIIALFEEKIERDGSVSIKERTGYTKVTDPEEITNFPLSALIPAACHYRFIPQEYRHLANILRLARNALLHDLLPPFELDGECYRTRIYAGRNRNDEVYTIDVSFPEEEETRILGSDPQEMWAYFLLTRTRTLLEVMYRMRVKLFPPEL